MTLASSWSQKSLDESLCTDEVQRKPLTIYPLTVKKCVKDSRLLGCIESVEDTELRVSLPAGMSGTVSVMKISKVYSQRIKDLLTDTSQEMISLKSLYNVGDLVQCKVLSNEPTVKLSIRPSDFSSDLKSFVESESIIPGCVVSDEDHGYVIDVGVKNVNAFLLRSNATLVKESFEVGAVLPCCIATRKNSSSRPLSESAIHVKIDPKALNKSLRRCVDRRSLTPGTKVRAVVKKVGIGMKVRVSGHLATLHKDHMLPEDFKLKTGSEIEARVLCVTPRQISLTRLPHITDMFYDRSDLFPDVKVGQIRKGFRVLSHDDERVLLIFRARYSAFHQILENERQWIGQSYPVSSRHRAKIESFNYLENKIRVTLLSRKRKRLSSDSLQPEHKMETKKCHTDYERDAIGNNRISCGFSWDSKFHLPASKKPEEAVIHNDSVKIQEKSKHKKSFKQDLEDEKKLFELEREAMMSDANPKTPEAFERLLLQSPNKSSIWLRYVAHHLEMSEVSKARAVAKRALDTITHGEDQERWNIWIAMMNLEVTYGSNETTDDVLLKSAQQNEPWKAYNQLLQIYLHSQKFQNAESLFERMHKKFKRDKRLWIENGQYLYRQGRLEDARSLLQRSLLSVNKNEHIEVISKFSQFECSYGQLEVGKSMFEKLLSTYPRRIDLWFVYIDKIVKEGEVKDVRQIFERLLSLSLPPKKMKFIFKKYINFETQFGTTKDVESVKQKAQEYVDNHL